MKNVFTKKWFEAATVRALKTMAQTVLGVAGASVMISDVDWKMVISSALLSGILSYCTSVAGLPEVQD